MSLEILDLLASDVKIVDSTVRTASENGATLRFPGGLMPDGRDYIAQAPAQLTPTLLKEWCNAVRGEYDARQNRKEAAQASHAAVRDAGGDGGNRPANEPGGSGNGTAGDGEAGETSLEESLKSEVARWAKRVRSASEEEDRLTHELEQVRAARAAATASHVKAQKVLDFYLSQNTEVEEL